MQIIYQEPSSNDRRAIVVGLEPGEEIFVVRARDSFALGILSHYIAMIDVADLFNGERLMQLRGLAQRFKIWRRSNVVRDPD